MKMKKVNTPGSAFRHVVTHACADSAPNRTFAARCSMAIKHGKVTFMWRIFNGGIKRPRKAKVAK